MWETTRGVVLTIFVAFFVAVGCVRLIYARITCKRDGYQLRVLETAILLFALLVVSVIGNSLREPFYFGPFVVWLMRSIYDAVRNRHYELQDMTVLRLWERGFLLLAILWWVMLSAIIVFVMTESFENDGPNLLQPVKVVDWKANSWTNEWDGEDYTRTPETLTITVAFGGSWGCPYRPKRQCLFTYEIDSCCGLCTYWADSVHLYDDDTIDLTDTVDWETSPVVDRDDPNYWRQYFYTDVNCDRCTVSPEGWCPSNRYHRTYPPIWIWIVGGITVALYGVLWFVNTFYLVPHKDIQPVEGDNELVDVPSHHATEHDSKKSSTLPSSSLSPVSRVIPPVT